jgi:hypothetical protein
VAKVGVPPQEYQTRSKPMIEHVNESIERTARLTGLSPETVLKQGIIRSKIPLYALSRIAQLDQRTALRGQCLHLAEADVRPPRRKSGLDPSRKSSTPFAVTYEAATLPSGRAKLLSSG